MRLLAILLLVSLVACGENESAKLERQLKIMETTGSTDADLCAKAQQVADAYLAEENQAEYEMAKVHAGTYCVGAQVEHLEGK
jgi:hypothetical protein